MTTEEIRQIASSIERRLIESGDPFSGDDWGMMQVARAYLAEHPPDDGQKTTEEWLEIVGLPLATPGYGIRLTEVLSLWDSSIGWSLYFHDGDGDAFMLDGEKSGPRAIVNAGTRGRVRSICKTLNIPLKESK